MRLLSRSSNLTPANAILLFLILLFFAFFLIAPLGYVVIQSFFPGDKFDLRLFTTLFQNPLFVESIVNSLLLATAATGLTLVVAIPLGLFFARYRFPGKNLLSAFLLAPLILPPFVGAVGMKQIFARSGSVNLLLESWGIPAVDWLGSGGFWAIVIMQALHLYPIIHLNLVAALSSIDPSLEEAARNSGASGFRLLRTVTLPLVLPGLFAGAILVFIWSFTDLGTPLVWDYKQVVAVSIFNQASETSTNPIGYLLVLVTLVLTAVLFYASKLIAGEKSYAMIGHGTVGERDKPAGPAMAVIIYTFTLLLLAAALLPHFSVILNSVSGDWFMTVLPSNYTTQHYREVWEQPMSARGIRLSLMLSVGSTFLDILLGVGIAYLLTRRRFPGKHWLDALAMLPLAAPGVVLAFGYITCYAGSPLDPRINPVPLLILSYAVRRLPFMVRAVIAGFQSVSVTLEEAARNTGATPFRTLRTITLPLVLPSLIAGSILAFAFAMLEVSDSLILAFKQSYYPLAKVIYVLMNDSASLASALGVLGMVLLLAAFVITQKLMGSRMGNVFRT